MNKIIAVDFDNTLFFTNWPDIILPNWVMINRVKEEKALGHKIILWTCRSGKYLEDAVEACRAVGLEFDAVNENLPDILEEFESDCRKIFANEYWDDLAVKAVYEDCNGKVTSDINKSWYFSNVANKAITKEAHLND